MAHAWAKLAQLRVHLTRSRRRLKKGATEEVCGARAFPGLCLPIHVKRLLLAPWFPAGGLAPAWSRLAAARRSRGCPLPRAARPTHTPPCLQAEGASRLLGPRPRGPDAECRVPPARPHSGAPGTNGGRTRLFESSASRWGHRSGFCVFNRRRQTCLLMVNFIEQGKQQL